MLPSHLGTSSSGQTRPEALIEMVRSWPDSMGDTGCTLIVKWPALICLCILISRKHRSPVHAKEQLLVWTAALKIWMSYWEYQHGQCRLWTTSDTFNQFHTQGRGVALAPEGQQIYSNNGLKSSIVRRVNNHIVCLKHWAGMHGSMLHLQHFQLKMISLSHMTIYVDI